IAVVRRDQPYRLQVVERHANEALYQRLESRLYLAAAGRRQGGERAAVEGLLHDDDRRLGDALVVAILARHLDRRLGRLEAGIAEEHLVEAGDLGDAVRRRLLVWDAPEIRGVDDAAVDAVEQRLLEFRVA